MSTVRIPLTTPVATRLALLERRALEGARASSVVNLARTLCTQARASSAGAAWWWIRPLVAVQALPIVGDPPGVDVYTDALYTLANGGDCANKTALLAALYIAARPYCGANRVRIVWEHCGDGCAFDHVRLDFVPGSSVSGERWVLDALSPVSPGARAVSWRPVESWPGGWL